MSKIDCVRTEEFEIVAFLLLLYLREAIRTVVLVILLVKIRRRRSVKMTFLLVNLLAKTDLVSKTVSKIGKMVDIGWSLVILTF